MRIVPHRMRSTPTKSIALTGCDQDVPGSMMYFQTKRIMTM